MNLSALFDRFRLPVYSPVPPENVTGLAFDSRKVKPGDLFVVLSGPPSDGHRYIPDAVARGAAAVVGSEALSSLPVPYIQVENSRQALAHLSAAWYGYPAQKLTMIGVTGTDGKTTTCNLIHKILSAAGKRVGLISTVNAVIGEQVLDTGFHVTTPDAPDVQRYLAMMVTAGLTHAVVETTSHGLAQYRVDAGAFDIGAVTNITHEHLNFHGSYEAYRAAKGRLFTQLAVTAPKPQGNPRVAVLNRDDGSYPYLRELVQPGAARWERGETDKITPLSYGFHPEAELRAEAVQLSAEATRFTAVYGDTHFPVVCRLLGEFNIANCLAAIGVTLCGLSLEVEAIQRGIAALEGVPGRMERIDLGQAFSAFVDFAHTPNALRCTLQTARKMTPGRVIAVFGSAGARDREKRYLMAEVSAELADLTVLTAEDPRTESLNTILAEMAAGAERRGGIEGQTFWRITDRGEAIRYAVSVAQPGDILLVCGKGHEQSMCFGEEEFPWDDRTALRAALAEWLGIAGVRMPFLPTSQARPVEP